MPTAHYRRIRQFMQHAGQETPSQTTIPDEETRLLRARLILEEALETVHALGVSVHVGGRNEALEESDLHLQPSGPVDLEGVVDGCADVSVVTMGTLVAFGIDDEPILEEVDSANLRKFGPGGYRREDGKWMKPADWTPPDIEAAIARGNPWG